MAPCVPVDRHNGAWNIGSGFALAVRVRLGGFGGGYGFEDVGVAGPFRGTSVEIGEAVEISGVRNASGKGVESMEMSLGVNK